MPARLIDLRCRRRSGAAARARAGRHAARAHFHRGSGHAQQSRRDYLEELSDHIGGRVTGSPQANEAIKWGMAKMQAIGLSNVHAEKWQISHGWTRGSASASLVDPIQRPLTISSLGWVGSTPKGGVQARL